LEKLGEQRPIKKNRKRVMTLFIIRRKNVDINKINFDEKFAKLPSSDYAVGIIAKMNNYEFKVVKRKGDFIWHSHEDTDETFIILDGTMTMNFRDHTVEINKGEMIVIPKGVEHKPSSSNGYKALLIELEDTPNTGNVKSDMTIKKIEWV
jgi:mannose-6-phosphate isomerase-like protein (cupin superfamily)